MLNRAIVLFVTLLCGAAAVVRANRPEQAPARVSFAEFPTQLGGWSGQQLPPIEDKVLAVLGVDDYLNRAYYGPERSAAGLYIGYYKSQRQGDSIHSPQNCLPGAGWEPLAQGLLTIAAPAAAATASISVNRYVIQKGVDRQLVLYLVPKPRPHRRERVLEQVLPGAGRRPDESDRRGARPCHRSDCTE